MYVQFQIEIDFKNFVTEKVKQDFQITENSEKFYQCAYVLNIVDTIHLCLTFFLFYGIE